MFHCTVPSVYNEDVMKGTIDKVRVLAESQRSPVFTRSGAKAMQCKTMQWQCDLYVLNPDKNLILRIDFQARGILSSLVVQCSSSNYLD